MLERERTRELILKNIQYHLILFNVLQYYLISFTLFYFTCSIEFFCKFRPLSRSVVKKACSPS